jgi:dCTP deaminase
MTDCFASSRQGRDVYSIDLLRISLRSRGALCHISLLTERDNIINLKAINISSLRDDNSNATQFQTHKMSIKSDKWIRRMAGEYHMIEPYEPGQVKLVDGKRIVSYGTSSYGYDIRCADEFKLFTNINSTIVDPKEFDEKNFVDIKGDSVIIPPNSFALARTVEYFRIPRNVLTICLGKSTYARCGILVNVTPFEPEWEGYVTLEFSNTTPLPAKIYANEGVAQVIFFESDDDDVCETSYKDRGGKYQGQRGVTLPKM